MTTKADLDPSQATLRMRRAKDAATAQSAQTGLRMIGHEELLGRSRLEALSAGPGHVLDGEEGAISHDDVIQRPICDDGSRQAFDDGGEDGEGGWGAVVGSVDEDVGGGAFFPDLLGRVDGGLHVAAVEVDAGAFGEVVEGSGEAEDVPE